MSKESDKIYDEWLKQQAVLDFLNERIWGCIKSLKLSRKLSGGKTLPKVYSEYILYVLREYWQQKQLLLKQMNNG